MCAKQIASSLILLVAQLQLWNTNAAKAADGGNALINTYMTLGDFYSADRSLLQTSCNRDEGGGYCDGTCFCYPSRCNWCGGCSNTLVCDLRYDDTTYTANYAKDGYSHSVRCNDANNNGWYECSYCNSRCTNCVCNTDCDSYCPTPAPTPNPTPNPTPFPTPFPTPAPTPAPTDSPTADPTIRVCDMLDATCRVSGDPHFKTWDSTYYHYMGGDAYYDYVINCNGEDELPFSISAYQEKCNPSSQFAPSCIREVLVNIAGTVYSFPGNGIPTLKNSGSDARGDYSITGLDYTIDSYKFVATIEDDEGELIPFEMRYKGTTLTMKTSNCFQDKLCGLCGYFNGYALDDFTTCDDVPQVIDSTGTAQLRVITPDAWARTHQFGDSCCNEEYDNLYLDGNQCAETDLVNANPPPDPVCLGVAAGICQVAWDTDCTSCGTNSDITVDEFIETCCFDICAEANNDLTLCTTYECAAANGFLATSFDLCEVDCAEGGVLPSPSPTKHGIIKGDPHFMDFNGKRFNFQGDLNELELHAWEYMTPCEESYLRNEMPFKLLGKHTRIDPKRNESGVEYIMLELYDYSVKKMYVVWISSIIHSYMEVELNNRHKTNAPFQLSSKLLYHDYIDNAVDLVAHEHLSLGNKFVVVYKQPNEKMGHLDITIDGKCNIPVTIMYQGIERKLDARHAVHEIDFDLSPCYECYTCGLMGEHLCDDINQKSF